MSKKPEIAIRFSMASFLRALRRLSERERPGQGRELARRVRESYPAIVAGHQELVVDDQSNGHLHMSALVLAGYQVLAPVLGDQKAVELLAAAFRQFMRGPLKLVMRMGLALSRDPLRLMDRIWSSKRLQQRMYGQTFVFATELTPTGYRFDTHRCFFFEFFRSQGLPHLTYALCAWDNNWLEEVNRRRDVHGEFTARYATGGNFCRFVVERR